MNEYKTIDSLFKKFANPIKEDYEALAVSLMKNFSITKCEKDSEGIRNVKYRIADLEIYQYSTDDTEDVATLNTFFRPRSRPTVRPNITYGTTIRICQKICMRTYLRNLT